MRSLFIAFSVVIFAGLAAPAGAEEYILNCRLLTTDNWLYRQHCRANEFSRLAVPETVIAEENWHPKKKKHASSKKHKKNAYLKKRIYAKKHALLKKKEYLKKKLHWKLAYLEKKLQAEWRKCKANPKCQLIVKRKLAKLYSSPADAGLAPTLSTTASRTLSGTTNTVGSVATTAAGTLSRTTNTAGNALSGTTDAVGNTATGATNTVGNTVSGATKTVGGVLD